jgi:hypothetical protein
MNDFVRCLKSLLENVCYVIYGYRTDSHLNEAGDLTNGVGSLTVLPNISQFLDEG